MYQWTAIVLLYCTAGSRVCEQQVGGLLPNPIRRTIPIRHGAATESGLGAHMAAAALVFAPTMEGMMLASATLSPCTPRTFSDGSTTAPLSVSGPILHVPTG